MLKPLPENPNWGNSWTAEEENQLKQLLKEHKTYEQLEELPIVFL